MRKTTKLVPPHTESRVARYLARKGLKARQIAALLRVKNTVAEMFMDLESGAAG